MANNFFKKLNENGNPTGYLHTRKNLQTIYPGLDLDNSADLKKAGFCYHLNTPKPIYFLGNYVKKWINNGDKLISENTYDFDWIEYDETNDLSVEELQNRKNRAWFDLREIRDGILKNTDWWELSSQSPMSEARTAYRQALRDLPSNTTDPFNVTWPINPDCPPNTVANTELNSSEYGRGKR